MVSPQARHWHDDFVQTPTARAVDANHADPITATDPTTATGRPRIVYLVTTHRDPPQVLRLVHALREGNAPTTVVVHHNATACPLDPQLLAGLEDVHLVEWSKAVHWGDWSLAERQLHALRWVLSHVDFDWLVLLSGQDYPIQPMTAIEEHLSTSPYGAIFPWRPVRRGDPVRGDEVWRRYHFRFFAVPWLPHSRQPPVPCAAGPSSPTRRPGAGRRLAQALERHQHLAALRLMPPGVPGRIGVRRWRTPFDENFPCHKGSAWLTVRREPLARALALLDTRPELTAYYRRTLLPEESLLQTLLVNDAAVRVDDTNLRFEIWDRRQRSGSPAVLRVQHLPAMLASGRHFARKVDPAVDSELLDRIDEVRRAETRAGVRFPAGKA